MNNKADGQIYGLTPSMRAAPLALGREQLADQEQVLLPDPPPAYDPLLVHGPGLYRAARRDTSPKLGLEQLFSPPLGLQPRERLQIGHVCCSGKSRGGKTVEELCSDPDSQKGASATHELSLTRSPSHVSIRAIGKLL
jgi:hypothetical protein